jgi:serine phosphatase RsbU (regulator of sigma subunit)
VAIGEIPEDELTARTGAMLLEILRRTHLSPPHELGTVFAEEARQLGIERLIVYLVDYEQRTLMPVPGQDARDREVVPVGGTIAGRCYTSTAILDTEAAAGRRVWVPLLDGTERLGVVEMEIPAARDELPRHAVAILERFAHFIAAQIATKDPYTDVFKLLRRREQMTSSSELLRELVPPSVLATKDFVLAAVLEPAYDNGGDAYDYAFNGDPLHLAIFDGVGHGLPAAGVTTYAMSVYRHRRRLGADLAEMYAAIDRDVALLAPDRYVTAVLAELDVGAGRMRWLSAGHPPPLLLRGGRYVKELGVPPSPPMGTKLEDGEPAIGEVDLEPGDMVLFYTDGLTESRRPDGSLFTTERLAEFIERQAGAGAAAPDTLRRLRAAIIERGEGTLRDDATAMLIEWRRRSEKALLPETVLDDER